GVNQDRPLVVLRLFRITHINLGSCKFEVDIADFLHLSRYPQGPDGRSACNSVTYLRRQHAFSDAAVAKKHRQLAFTPEFVKKEARRPAWYARLCFFSRSFFFKDVVAGYFFGFYIFFFHVKVSCCLLVGPFEPIPVVLCFGRL